jgi:hypothetical protein
VRGPGIAELCSVVSRVARETQPSIILVGTSAALTRRRAGSVGMLGGGGSNTVLTFLITTPASQAFSLRVAACLPYLPQGQGPRAIDLISYPTRGYVWRVERHHKRVRVVCRLARDGETQRSVTSFALYYAANFIAQKTDSPMWLPVGIPLHILLRWAAASGRACASRTSTDGPQGFRRRKPAAPCQLH